MDLRLIYKGPLQAKEGEAVKQKHDIRRQLRHQLLDHVRRRSALSLFASQIAGTETIAPHGTSSGERARLGSDWSEV